MIQALLVDDERLARARMRRLLAAHPVEVVAEAASVAQARGVLAARHIDVVFLDVHMPGVDGFGLLDGSSHAAAIVFVTADASHAARAFDVEAADYLVKPVHPDRLARCLQRLASRPRAELRIETPEGTRFVEASAVLAVRAAGDYTEVVLADGARPLVRTTLAQWEARLPPNAFVRVHRSALVQLAAIERLERAAGRTTLWVRGDAEPIAVSRRAASGLDAALRNRVEDGL